MPVNISVNFASRTLRSKKFGQNKLARTFPNQTKARHAESSATKHAQKKTSAKKSKSKKTSNKQSGYRLDSLEHVNASALPADVLVLLSKYAVVLRKHNGLILKLSSLNIFRHVHSTNQVSQHAEVHSAYRKLLLEVRRQVQAGNMYTNAHKRFKDKRVKRPYSAMPCSTEVPSNSEQAMQQSASEAPSHLLGKIGAVLRTPVFSN